LYENKTSLVNLTIAGTLTAGDLAILDDVTIADMLTVNGNTDLNGTLEVAGSSALVGAIVASSTLSVTGATTLNAALAIAGTLTGAGFSFVGNGIVSGDLTVGGNITGNFTISGAQTFTSLSVTDLQVSASASIGANLAVTGATSTATLTVSGSATFAGDLNTGECITINSFGEVCNDLTNMRVTNTKDGGVLNLQTTDTGSTLNTHMILGSAAGTGTFVGFHGTAGQAQPALYTQTFATATRTHNAPTGLTLTDSTTGVVGNTINDVGAAFSQTAINDNFAGLTDEVNNLVADLANAKEVLNQVLDDLQTYGLLL
jgi:cytoskeletal protein CcmA (bactofilin family)